MGGEQTPNGWKTPNISIAHTAIQLLESPIPTTATTASVTKASSGDILGTKCGIIDPLVPKQP